MVAMQREDIGPQTHGVVIEHGNQDHNSLLYKIHVTKTGHIITRMAWHVKLKPITTEQCLGDQLNKAKNYAQDNSDFEKLIHTYAYVSAIHQKHCTEKVSNVSESHLSPGNAQYRKTPLNMCKTHTSKDYRIWKKKQCNTII